jgi:hypothetical protein
LLRQTKFPEIERHGGRGEAFHYPERLIMLISVLAVKCQVKRTSEFIASVACNASHLSSGHERLTAMSSASSHCMAVHRWPA